MKMCYGTTLKVLILSCAALCFQVGLDRAHAQEASARLPASASALIELAPETLSQLIASLSGVELAEALAGATSDQRSALVDALAPEDRETLLTGLAQAGASPDMLADVVVAMIVAAPESAGPVIEAITQSSPGEDLPMLAEQMILKVAGGCSLFEADALAGVVLAAVSFDSGAADRLVRFGNSADEGCVDQLARALADISETADDAIASAIEVALALEGGVMAQRVSELRGEVDVAATPQTPAPPAPTPAVAPAGVGGAGSVPGSTPGSGAGEDAIFAQNGQGGALSLAGAGGLVPLGEAQDVSP